MLGFSLNMFHVFIKVKALRKHSKRGGVCRWNTFLLALPTFFRDQCKRMLHYHWSKQLAAHVVLDKAPQGLTELWTLKAAAVTSKFVLIHCFLCCYCCFFRLAVVPLISWCSSWLKTTQTGAFQARLAGYLDSISQWSSCRSPKTQAVFLTPPHIHCRFHGRFSREQTPHQCWQVFCLCNGPKSFVSLWS